MPNKINTTKQGLVTSGEGIRNKRAIPAVAIIQGVAAIGGMMAKAIIPVLKDFKQQINNTNDRLNRQYQMMMKDIIDYLGKPIRPFKYTI